MEAIASKRTTEQNRKLWWLFGRMGFDRDAVAYMVDDWTGGRTEHTSELTFIEARDLIGRLESLVRKPRAKKEDAELDRLRKGCLRSIFAYFEMVGKRVSMEYVKGVACRAAGGKTTFNDIEATELRRIYAEFCKKQSTCEAAVKSMDEAMRGGAR